jgi:hypothetical protein
MVLQPIVENAVRYALGQSEEAVTIEVVATSSNGSLSLIVSDDGPGLVSPRPGRSGIGLTNTRNRLARLYGDSAHLAVSISCTTDLATDEFNRADGSLGPNWSDMSDGGLTISSDQVVGVNAAANSGDIRTAEAYGSDQYSQIQITSTQLSGGQWIGPAIRAQNEGQNLYTGIYWWNNGNPVLMLFKRVGGNWTLLGTTYVSGALVTGTTLQLSVIGSSLTLFENGAAVITATDSSLTGGAPGIIAYGAAAAGSWAGGDDTTASATYSVGGNVSGLSGTVVLEDNGGDNLSVTANGPLTFDTMLSSGATYDVTVEANPAGQSCTIANGSGTVASANITGVSVSCTANSENSASDNFNRANGNLGSNWTDMSDGGLMISSDQVVGTNAAANSGDIRTGETYPSNQFSQIEIDKRDQKSTSTRKCSRIFSRSSTRRQLTCLRLPPKAERTSSTTATATRGLLPSIPSIITRT